MSYVRRTKSGLCRRKERSSDWFRCSARACRRARAAKSAVSKSEIAAGEDNFLTPVIFVPVAPLEWHGPHLPLGMDALNAEEVAMGVCRQIGGLVWPTLFWGTDREHTEQEIKNLGFPPGSYIVGMDFPKNTLPSGYCPEEIFGVLVRETLRQISRMPVRLAVLVNGHEAVNQNTVLRRLATEFNHTTALGVYVRDRVSPENDRCRVHRPRRVR